MTTKERQDIEAIIHIANRYREPITPAVFRNSNTGRPASKAA